MTDKRGVTEKCGGIYQKIGQRSTAPDWHDNYVAFMAVFPDMEEAGIIN